MSSARVVGGLVSVVVSLSAGVVSAQDYPNKTIRIVTSAAGGGGDFMARLIAQGITGPLGQPVIVENRGGALTADIVSKAPPDGYTLSLSGAGLWVTPLVQKANYDAIRDFTPVCLAVREVNVLAVHPSLPVKSVKDLIGLAKAHPGQLNFGSDYAGGPYRLGAELFKSMAGVDIVNISYRGQAPAITGLISGEIQLIFADLGLIIPQVKAGKLKALAVTSGTPSALVPDLPTVAATVPGYESVAASGVLGPAKLPAPIVTRLNQEIVRFLNRPETKERLLSSGIEAVGTSPDQFSAVMKSDVTKWSQVIKDVGIKVE